MIEQNLSFSADLRTLAQCLQVALDGDYGPSPDMGAFRRLLSRFLNDVQTSPGELARRLRFDAPALNGLRDELARLLATLETPPNTEFHDDVALRQRICTLRSLDWFISARERDRNSKLPSFDELGNEERAAAFRQVFAIESLIRALYSEFLRDDLTAIESHLKRRMNEKAFKQALRRAQAGQPLSGLEFSELITLFVAPEDWPQAGAPYEHGRLLTFLKRRSATVETFLDDVRRIRNRVVHGRPITGVHKRLMAIYSQTLVEPIRDAFPQLTSVDPRVFDTPSDARIQNYEQTVRRLDPEIRRIRHVQWVSLFATAVLTALVLPIGIPRLLDFYDPARLDIAAVEHAPHLAMEVAARRCEIDDSGTVARLSKLPVIRDRDIESLRTAWRSNDIDHLRLVQLAAAYPDRLARCVPALQSLGWDPNQASQTSAANDFNPSNNHLGPDGIAAGYLSFQLAAVRSEMDLPSPAGLAGNALLYAVWHRNLVLVDALLMAGADPRIALSSHFELSPDSEARRLGYTDVADRLARMSNRALRSDR